MSATRAILLGITLVSCCVVARPAIAQESSQPESKLYWIFLTSGQTTQGVAADEIRKMQSAHLANFKRLADAGKLLTAGPMNDSQGILRGIVIIKAANGEAVDQMFDADPYVKKGFMKVEKHEATIDHGQFATKITPAAMEELRIVVFVRTPGVESETHLADQANYVAKLAGEQALLLTANFDGSRHSTWIAKPRADLKRIVDTSPAVTAGELSYQIIPIYLGKGAIVAKQTTP